MEFVSLHETLNSVADCVTVSPSADADEADELKFSEAAAIFHEVLHNFPDLRPKWMELNKETGRYLLNDAVRDEGMEMLIHMAGWYKRESTFRAETHRDEQLFIDWRSGELLAKPSLDDHEKKELSVLQRREIPERIAVGPGRNINSGKYRMDKLFRYWKIGFDLAPLVAFLNQYGISHTLDERAKTIEGGVNPTDEPLKENQQGSDTDKDKLKSEKQHDAILAAIALKKFKPMMIPDGGKGELKSLCETHCDLKSLFDRDTSFDNAWKSGSKKGLFRMENHASYVKRGNQ
ncbi:MAG: hypothetical protein CTY16_15795 [Methylobacter sp.]|nr:MAG: hypothetical protein CTY16_15795 [Methylobacter sp.]